MQQRDFCRVMDISIATKPTNPRDGTLLLGFNLIQEEYTELMAEYSKLTAVLDDKSPHTEKEKEALGHVYLQNICAELADLIYVACQAANMHGLPLPEFYSAIHKANMAKVDPETGKVERREDGKILKPEGWEPADLDSIYLKARR